jgi:flagella basal body P-ring formation protein FlgA
MRFVLCGLGLVLFASLAFSAQLTITLKTKADVEPGVVRLGQIAEIKGDAMLAERISNLEVGKVAEPGRKTRVTEKAIKGFFIKAVANSNEVVFDGAKFSDVAARSGFVSGNHLKELLLKEIRQRMPVNLQEGKDWNFESPKMPERLVIPERGGKILTVLPPQFLGIGQELASIQIFNGSKMISKHSVPFIIHRFEYVAQLKNGIRKGEIIGEQDFEMVWQETTFQKRKVIKKESEAVGRTAIRTLKASDLLVDNALAAPYAVKEGESVKLFVKFGESVVQTNGIAQRSAFKGQTVSFRNIDSGKEILATVSGQGEALVN